MYRRGAAAARNGAGRFIDSLQRLKRQCIDPAGICGDDLCGGAGAVSALVSPDTSASPADAETVVRTGPNIAISHVR